MTLVISYKPELKKVTRQKREKRQMMARDMAFFQENCWVFTKI